MAAGHLPSFHDAYVQVLAQLETLKRVHAIQLATEPQSDFFLMGPIAGGDDCNGGSTPTVQHEIRLVMEMNEKNCIKDERSVLAKEGAKTDRKRGSTNFLSDGDVAESINAPAVEQAGHKKVKNGTARDAIFQGFDLNEEMRQEIRQPADSNEPESTREEAVMVDGDRKRRQKEVREEVYKELTDVLAGYVKLEDLDLNDGRCDRKTDSFALQLGDRVREVFDLLELEKIITKNLRRSVLQRDQENQKLHRENDELQEKLRNALSSLQQEFSLCRNCKCTTQAATNTHSTRMPTQNQQTAEISTDAGEEVAAEVIRSFSMTPNHRSAASTSVHERFRVASGDAARPLSGLQFNSRVFVPSAQQQEAAAVPTPASSKRKALANGGSLHGRYMSEKTKRLCEIGRELAKRASFRAEGEHFTPLLELNRFIHNNKLRGDDLSESDTESVIKRVINLTDHARPWINAKAGAKKSFTSPLDSITERSPTIHQPETDTTIKKLHSKNQSPGLDTSEATLGSARYIQKQNAAAIPIQEIDKNSVELTKDLLHELHAATEQRKTEYEEGNMEKTRTSTTIYKEYDCGVSTKSGDTTGVLRVHQLGVFQVFCNCADAPCTKGVAMTPWDFERHGGRGSSKKWRDSIWVKQAAGQKVPVSRVKELNMYVHSNNSRKDGKRLRISAAAAARAVRQDDVIPVPEAAPVPPTRSAGILELSQRVA